MPEVTGHIATSHDACNVQSAAYVGVPFSLREKRKTLASLASVIAQLTRLSEARGRPLTSHCMQVNSLKQQLLEDLDEHPELHAMIETLFQPILDNINRSLTGCEETNKAIGSGNVYLKHRSTNHASAYEKPKKKLLKEISCSEEKLADAIIHRFEQEACESSYTPKESNKLVHQAIAHAQATEMVYA